MLDDGEDLIDYYLRCMDNLVVLPNGQREFGNLYELYEIVDIFASQYGMGGCRTLEEYASMINNTDPVILNMLKTAMAERLKRQNSAEPIPHKVRRSPTLESTKERPMVIPIKPQPVSIAEVDIKANQINMRRFLSEMGADKGALNIAVSELGDGKIKLRDYRWVDGDTLEAMPPKQFDELLKNMGDDIKNSKNFKVSLNTLVAKKD